VSRALQDSSRFGPASPPRATYRLQFHERFRLADALALVPYLHELGISHLYASPLTKARPHSTHGYDVCDYQQLNPELGTEADLAALIAALREKRMGLVLDIVPNHMGIGPENPWWWDVLTHGRRSAFADHFDIDWESPDPRTRGKVLLPILDRRYADALNGNEISLEIAHGKALLRYADNYFPVASPGVLSRGDAAHSNSNPDVLDQLVQRQNYRLTYRKHGDTGLNYRRFFSISSLAGVRVEDRNVFDNSHALVKTWLQQNWIDGLRVDHPDGLRDPAMYLRRLRAIAPEAWIVVEKILEPGEPLPAAWPVAGTTGYDFLNQVNGLFVKPQSEQRLTTFYSEFTGESSDYEKAVREKKRAVLDTLFAAETSRLLEIVVRLAARDWRWRDFSRGELRDAIAELAACLPVYRTYARSEHEPVRRFEQSCVERALHLALARRPDLPGDLLGLLVEVLSGRQRGELENEFVARFQQLTGPAMGKGVEDTAFYCYNRFVSLNEVGGNPGAFGVGAGEFHRFCQAQQSAWPDTMLASSTHDTKRGEDARARLNVLSEIPEQWIAAVGRWSAMNERHRGALLDRNAEYLFYQTLVGAWPLSVERATAYMEKASREAKQHTDWDRPNAAYDLALRNFVAAVMRDPAFVSDVDTLVSRIRTAGFVNALAQTLIKLTAPGVPDIYQGSELWNFDLVDPDNRRAVDFGLRRGLLAEAQGLSAGEAWIRREDGLAKLWLITKTLNLRAAQPGLFSSAAKHEPLPARGQKCGHVLAFRRGVAAITVVPRFPLTLNRDWADTALDLPRGTWRNVLTGELVDEQPARLAALLASFPVALLIRTQAD
jgi:(1->4)-alpha-D-glucan 1-alpha-D-glucosylmutase